MKPREILSEVNHRPIPLPKRQWVIYQEWHDVLFIHWETDVHELQKFVPGELNVETFKGTAWVSLVVFRLANIRPRLLPPIPPISNVNEINIRTYVKYKGKPGIYFLSMELGKTFSNFLARYLTGLPYRYSKIYKGPAQYSSGNKLYGDRLEVKYEIQSKLLNKSALDKWLTERYVLFQDSRRNSILAYEIHHHEWPLHDVKISGNNIKYDRFGKLIQSEPALVHYSPGVEVLTWGRRNYSLNDVE